MRVTRPAGTRRAWTCQRGSGDRSSPPNFNRGSARFYLGNVVVFAIALVPYLLCAVIWLRTRSKSRAGELAGITTSGLLLLFALASLFKQVAVVIALCCCMGGLMARTTGRNACATILGVIALVWAIIR